MFQTLNWIFYKVVQTNSQEVFIATILFLVVGASTLAHFFGFSYSLGAFLAGMMMAETQYKHQIEVDLIPFRDLLLGLFFITVGMQINFVVVLSNIWLVLGLVFSIMVVNAIVVFAVLNIYLKRRVAAKTALSVCQIGEFALAVFGLIEVIKRFMGLETPPDFLVMIVISFIALIANTASLWLLQRTKSKEAHIQASVIFSANDVIVNIGVIVAGLLVGLLNSNAPDLIIGIIVFLIVIRGAIRILKLSK